jgi:citrate lyase gamma subunit
MAIIPSWRIHMTFDSPAKHNDTAQITLDDLVRKQSVRATFKLSREVIALLGVISGQLGIKQKSLLDKLIEDRLILNQLAKNARTEKIKQKERRQKTFVISRSSLNSINSIAKKSKIPRDVLVEISIKRLVPLIESELDKHHKRKLILEDMREFLKAGEKLKQRTRRLLGTDDELYNMIEKQLALTEKNISEINAIIEKGMPMEEW